MSETRREINHSTLVTGLIVMGVGILFLLQRFHVASLRDAIHNYWPMIFVLIGIPKLLRRDSYWSGLWFLALGGWFEAVHFHVFGLTYSNSWPLLLIVIGAGMVLRVLVNLVTRPEIEKKETLP